MFKRPVRQALTILMLSPAALTPAAAGEWVGGGMFDEQRGVGVSFLRFLADSGEGQMTVRCDARDGLWVDVGTGGNGQLPEGFARGDRVEAMLEFVGAGGVQSVTVTGPLLIRVDGAVLIEVIGEDAAALAPLLLLPADRLDITLGGVTGTITLAGFSDRAIDLADRCSGWPGVEAPGSALAAADAAGLPTLEALVSGFIREFGAGLPEFIIGTAEACFVETAVSLAPADQLAIREAGEFIAGVNAAVAANPRLAGSLFLALDACGGTLIVGDIMWLWVQAERADAAEAERVALGTCLIGAVDRLPLDAKRGIMRFTDGDFADAIEAMLTERPDLAGTIVEDLAACNAPL